MLNENGDGDVVFIPRMALDSGLEDSSVSFRQLQFPVRLAYAMTINKSQGQTVQHVELNLSTPHSVLSWTVVYGTFKMYTSQKHQDFVFQSKRCQSYEHSLD
jgi:hypothetical protein